MLRSAIRHLCAKSLLRVAVYMLSDERSLFDAKLRVRVCENEV